MRWQSTLPRSHSWRWVVAQAAEKRSQPSVGDHPAAVSETLKKHRGEQLKERLQVAVPYQDQDFVSATGNGNPLDWKVLVRRHFKRIVQRAGVLPIRPYDLRHTCASLFLAVGENVKVVSERLGHASAALTLDVYSHVLPDMQQQAAERLERILFQRNDQAHTASAACYIND